MRERKPLNSDYLMYLDLTVDPAVQASGPVAHGTRRITVITGGRFEGPRLKGRVVPGACAAWVLVGTDDVVRLDVNLTLRTDDGAWIYMFYPGIGAGSVETMRRVNTGQAAAPDDYYFRIAPRFETGVERYAWLNRILAIGVGERAADGPKYDVYEIR